MAGKPEKKIKEPEGPKHAPKPKKPRHPLLAAAAIGATLMGGSCAPSARAQETTPSRPAAMVQSPDVRVASAEVREPQRGAQAAPSRPQPVVAQAAPSGTRGYESTATGAPPPQIAEVAQQVVVESLAPLFQRSSQYERQLDPFETPRLPNISGSRWAAIPMGPGFPIFEVYVRLPSGELKKVGMPLGPSQLCTLLELPTAESDLAGPGMLAVVDPVGVAFYFYNKTKGDYDDMIIPTTLAHFPATKLAVIVEIRNGEPYLYILPPDSIQKDSRGNLIGILPGTVIAQVSVALNESMESSDPQNPGQHPATYSDVFRVAEE